MSKSSLSDQTVQPTSNQSSSLTEYQPVDGKHEICRERRNSGNDAQVVQTSVLKSIGIRQARTEKMILHGISLYFNPGELIGIMGPSGTVYRSSISLACL